MVPQGPPRQRVPWKYWGHIVALTVTFVTVIVCNCRAFLPPSMRFPGFSIGCAKKGPASRRPATASRERVCMGLQYFAGAAYRALTARKDGPSLYDVCDDVLLNGHSNGSRGDPHLIKFYKTALRNPAL